MQYGFALAAFLGLALAAPAPQGVTASIAPSSTPEACSPTYNNGATFQIGIVNASTAATGSKLKRAIPNGLDPNDVPGNSLILTLVGGELKDYFGRTGYVAENMQLQFDDPVQDGAIYTAGFSACPNGTLALGDAVWYECLSGTYYNLYDTSVAAQCSPSYLDIIPYSNSSVSSVAASSAVSTPTVAMSTMGYATTSAAAASITSAAPAVTSAAAPSPVTQITDGQVQAATTAAAAVVTQITDGQIQAPTNATTTLMPYNPNGAISTGVSSSLLILVAGVIGAGALL